MNELSAIRVLGTQRLALAPARDAILERALALGLEWLDTADVYGEQPGDAERWLASYVGRVRMATKGGLVREGTRWSPSGGARALEDAAERSRDRLQVPALDLWQWHAEDPRVERRRSLGAIRRIVERGVARRVGLSNPRVSTLEAACSEFPVSVVQIELSPGRPQALWSGVVDASLERGIPVWAYRPFFGEAGVRKLLRTSAVQRFATGASVSPAAVVLAWLRSLGVTPIPGPSSLEHVEDVLATLRLDLSALDEAFPDVGRLRAPRASRAAPRVEGEIVLLMGTPGAGKSTRVALYPDHFRLNRDERGGSLADLARALDAALAAGERRVVLDNTYPSRASRGEVIAVAQRYGVPVRCEWIETSADDAEVNVVSRLLDRLGELPSPEALRGARRDPVLLPPRALHRWRDELEPPSVEEGFDRVDPIPFVRRPSTGQHGLLLIDPEDLVERRDLVEVYRRDGFRIAVVGWGGPMERDRCAVLAEEAHATVFWCGHAAGPPVCWCRKPLPGLGVLALRTLAGDPARSRALGTGPADRSLARKLGVPLVDP